MATVVGSRGLVSAEAFISDESDFYGGVSEDEVEGDDKVERYLSFEKRLPASIVYGATNVSGPALNNMYKDQDNARQLDESVHEFVTRLRPSQTLTSSDAAETEHWIRIANPHFRPRNDANEDENRAAFVSRGRRLLEDYLEEKTTVEAENEGKSKAVVSKKLKPLSANLEKELGRLARRYNVTGGKWLIFAKLKEVDKLWRTVAEAVVDGRLGQSAKVATAEYNHSQSQHTQSQQSQSATTGTRRTRAADDSNTRLICAATEDFEDTKDVQRVLAELQALGLVDAKGIWYKTEAYSLLDITGASPYGIRASLYNSRDLLA